MKKLVFFALAIILVLSGVLVGCGGTTTTTATQTATQTSTQTVTSTATSTATTTATTTSTTTATVTATPTNPLGDLAKPAGGKGGGRLQLVGAGNIANIGDPNAISNPGDAAYAFPVMVLQGRPELGANPKEAEKTLAKLLGVLQARQTGEGAFSLWAAHTTVEDLRTLGFDPKVSSKLSLGLAKVTGDSNDFQGFNIRSASGEKTGDGTSGEKGSGMP